jgi:hypothetical protein
MLNRVALGLLLTVGLASFSCAQNREDAALEQAIDDLATGKVNRAVESENESIVAGGPEGDESVPLPADSVTRWQNALGALSLETPIVEVEEGDEEDAVSVLNEIDSAADSPAQTTPRDFCAQVEDPAEDADDAVYKAAIEAFGTCARRLQSVAAIQYMGIRYFISFKLPEGAPKLSEMEFGQLMGFVGPRIQLINSAIPKAAMPSAIVPLMRDTFSDEDLTELMMLYAQRQTYLAELTKILTDSASMKPNLMTHYNDLDRYRLLAALGQYADSDDHLARAMAITSAIRGRIRVLAQGQLQVFPNALLKPYSILAVIAREGNDDKPLVPRQDNPFMIAAAQLQELQGDPAQVDILLQNYKMVRDVAARTSIPDHPLPHADAVHVALLDSGIDYLRHRALGTFLGSGRAGELKSFGYGDNASDPWIPNVGILGHGTGTLSTVLTIMAQQSPDLLRDRKVDMAMWSVRSLEQILGGAPYNGPTFASRPLAVIDALVDQGEAANDSSVTHAIPDIVSISLGFRAYQMLRALGKGELLKSAPWLWVMAAGNSQTDVSRQRFTCLADAPANVRPVDQLLCVGALKKTEGEELQIASYSNFGDAVDVYAIESYDRLCPNGTSCSTPAVTGTAAVLKGRFPDLTPQQLKQVITATAQTQTLSVDLSQLRAQVVNLLRQRQRQQRRAPRPAQPAPPTQPQQSQLLAMTEAGQALSAADLVDDIEDSIAELAAPTSPTPTVDPALVERVLQQVIERNQIVTERDVKVFDPATMTRQAVHHVQSSRVRTAVTPVSMMEMDGM